jgi:hypothetical protein
LFDSVHGCKPARGSGPDAGVADALASSFARSGGRLNPALRFVL